MWILPRALNEITEITTIPENFTAKIKVISSDIHKLQFTKIALTYAGHVGQAAVKHVSAQDSDTSFVSAYLLCQILRSF